MEQDQMEKDQKQGEKKARVNKWRKIKCQDLMEPALPVKEN